MVSAAAYWRGADCPGWASTLIRHGHVQADVFSARVLTPSCFRWCFYKQNGVSTSRSLGGGLDRWEFVGSTESGENVCVLRDEAAVCSEKVLQDLSLQLVCSELTNRS